MKKISDLKLEVTKVTKFSSELKFQVTKVLTNKEFAKILEKRTLKFGIDIIRLSTTLPNTPEAKVVRNQITKSGTSIGANYREANRARGKADFKNKIKIC